MKTDVTRIDAAAPDEALAHFSARLRFETDCWDVHAALAQGDDSFVLIDARSPTLYDAGHVPGAVSLPHGRIVAGTLKRFAADALFVVYCAGPHCNGADKAAVRLAALGRQVKLMIGGITGWLDEGFTLATSGQANAHAGPAMPQPAGVAEPQVN